jgi:hypothetical protein
MNGWSAPDFFIVGAPKCGTTALYTYLQQHPDVFMSTIKEPQFFAEDVLGDLRAVRTIEDYRRCFESAGECQTTGEASVAYLGSASALRAIQAFAPGARIIVMLRNPIEVMYSEYSQRIYDTREPAIGLQAALETEDRGDFSPWRRQGSRILGLGLRETVQFAGQLSEYLGVFGREGVHVVLYDDLKHSTALVYRDVLRFLGIRQDFQPVFRVIHGNKRVRSTAVQKFVLRPPAMARRIARATLPQMLRRAIGESLLHLNAPYAPRPAMDESLRRRLREQLRPEVRALADLLGRDLSHWN